MMPNMMPRIGRGKAKGIFIIQVMVILGGLYHVSLRIWWLSDIITATDNQK